MKLVYLTVLAWLGCAPVVASEAADDTLATGCRLPVTAVKPDGDFCAEVSIKNTGSVASSRWELELELPAGVALDFADGAVIDQSAGIAYVTSDGTYTIEPGDTVAIGVCNSTAASLALHARAVRDPVCGATPGLTARQRAKAEKLTSVWENATTVLQYAYSEDIGDGRGYTAGRAGFCSGTGDALLVVECFDRAGTGNRMHKYLPELRRLNDLFEDTGDSQADTSRLDALGDYSADWATSAASSAFRACQDEIVSQFYEAPALATARRWGATSPLSIAALYDAEINHGDDGVAELVAQANTDTGNPGQHPASEPLARAAETAWLRQFLAHRLATLAGDESWRESVDRVALYEKERRADNWNLVRPIATDAKAGVMFPGQGYLDSGYPVCTIAPLGTAGGDPECTTP